MILWTVVSLFVVTATPLGGLLPAISSGFASGLAKEIVTLQLDGDPMEDKKSRKCAWIWTLILRGGLPSEK
jgi:hypothetical protein